jgi:hypothetical protein
VQIRSLPLGAILYSVKVPVSTTILSMGSDEDGSIIFIERVAGSTA